MINLRPYQAHDIPLIRQAFKEYKRVLYQSPTGSGKTVTSAYIIEKATAKGQRSLFLAARRELIQQTSRKLTVDHSVLMAGDPRYDPSKPVQVASIQTALSRGTTFVPTFIFLDECAHSTSRSHQELLATFPDVPVLGLTATPVRQSGLGLGDYFQTMIKGPGIRTLIDDGHLVTVEHYLGPAPTTPRDKLVGDPVKAWMQLARGQTTMTFASSVEESKKLAERFTKETGYKFEHIDGETDPDIRDRIAERLESGELTGVVGYAVYIEGFDAPCISCVILDRAIGSLAVYLQACGRGLRPHRRKRFCTVLDHGNNLREWGRVDANREWKLTSGRDVIAGPSTPDVADDILVCPKCYLLAPNGSTYCACGYKFSVKKKKTYRHKPGTLELHHDDGSITSITEEHQKKEYERFLWMQRNGKKKDGTPFSKKFAFFRFYQQFGCHPKREWGSQ